MKAQQARRTRRATAFLAVAAATTIAATAPTDAAVRFSEVMVDANGTNSTQDFIELRSTTPGEDVSGLTLLQLEGDAGAAAGSGSIDRILTFSGDPNPSTTGANGLFLRHSFAAGPDPAISADTRVQNVGWSHENAAITYLLVSGFSGAPNQDLDTDDDGVLDATPWTSVLDAFGVLDGNSNNDRVYGAALGGADFNEQVQGSVPRIVFRAEDGTYHAAHHGTGGVDPIGGPYIADDSDTVEDGYVFSPGNINNPVNTPTRAWLGAGGGDWHNAANWTSGLVPSAAGDIAMFYGAGGSPVNLTSDVTVGKLSFNGGSHNIAAGGGTLTLDTPTVDDAFILVSYGNPVIAPPVVINKQTTISVPRGQVLTISGQVSGPGVVRKLDAGTMVLTGANTYTGGTIINTGLLIVSADNNLGDAAAPLAINNGILTSPVDLTVGAARVTTLGGTSGGFAAAAGTTLTVPGQITGTGALTTSGEGTVVISGAANDYVGSTRVLGGEAGSTLRLGAANALPVGTTLNMNPTSLTATATLDLGHASNTGFDQTVADLTIIGIDHDGDDGTPPVKPTTPVITNSGTGIATFTVDNAGFNSYEGTITGNVALAKSNFGTLEVLNANTYVGGTTISDGVLVLNGAGTLGSGDLTVNSSLQVNNSNAFGGISGTGATLIGDSAAAVTVSADHFRQNILDIANNATAVVNASSQADGVSKVNTLNIGSNARLDLKDNKLITAGSLGSFDGTAYTGVTGLIQAGRGSAGGNAQWNGTSGITTSDARAIDTSNRTSLGVIDASDKFRQPGGAPIGEADTALFAGQTVLGSDTLIMFTYGGDANLDGKINIDDYGRIDSNVGTPGANGWANGDFNYDGKINIDDYGIIDSNISQQTFGIFPTAADVSGLTASATAEGVAAVPEPAGLALLALLPAFARRRRRAM